MRFCKSSMLHGISNELEENDFKVKTNIIETKFSFVNYKPNQQTNKTTSNIQLLTAVSVIVQTKLRKLLMNTGNTTSPGLCKCDFFVVWTTSKLYFNRGL